MSFVDQVNSLSKDKSYFILRDEIIINLVKQVLDLEALKKKFNKTNTNVVFNSDNKRDNDKKRLQIPWDCIQGIDGMGALHLRVCDLCAMVRGGGLTVADPTALCSLAGCKPQPWHYDFDNPNHPEETEKSLLFLLALEDNASLQILDSSGNIITVKWNQGETCVATGATIHKGDGYDCDHYRAHWFADFLNNRRKHGRTYFYHISSKITEYRDYIAYYAVRRANIILARAGAKRIRDEAAAKSKMFKDINTKRAV